MKKSRAIDHSRVARILRSRVRGELPAGAGYFGALQVAEEVRRRFRHPSGGGRARDPRRTEKRLISVRPETLVRLERLANEVSSVVEHRVDPLQVAAVLIERDLDQLDDRELVASVKGRVR